jgi:predicted nicotinamide N-methyase
VPLRGLALVVLRPRDSEALLDDEAFEREEFLPYWAELWPGALALARIVERRSFRGARVVELGCGLAIPSIVAALRGARVLATDWSPDAMALAAQNAERNGATLERAVVSWADPGPLVARSPWDLVLASDVLYERRNVELLLDLLPQLVDERGEVLLAEPGRPPAAAFFAAAAAQWTTTQLSGRVPVHRLRRRVSADAAGGTTTV